MSKNAQTLRPFQSRYLKQLFSFLLSLCGFSYYMRHIKFFLFCLKFYVFGKRLFSFCLKLYGFRKNFFPFCLKFYVFGKKLFPFCLKFYAKRKTNYLIVLICFREYIKLYGFRVMVYAMILLLY